MSQNRSNSETNKLFSVKQVSQEKQGTSGFLALNGVEVREGSFSAKVTVPSENAIDIFIKRLDKDGLPDVRVHFEIVKGKGARFRLVSSIYLIDANGTTLVEAFDKASVDTLLGYIRVLLHTNKQGLPRNGRIANIIGAALVQALEEAKRRTKEYRAKIAKELHEQALKEPGLKDNLLRYVIDTLAYVHAGDEIAKKIAFLAIVSSRLPEAYRLSILFIAPSGRGKTNLLRALEAVTPLRWRLFETESLGSSPLALFYHAMENPGFMLDMRHRVWFVNEPSWLLLGQNEEDPGKRLMKQAISDITDREPKCYDTVVNINNTRKAVKLCLRGKPVIFATIQDKYSHLLNEQIISRMVPVMLDPAREILPNIIHHIVYVKTDANTKQEFERRAKLIRIYLSKEIPKVDVIVFTENAKAKIMNCNNLGNPSLCDGYMGSLLSQPDVESVITRATETLKSLAASIALLRRRFEKKDEHVVLTVTEDDVTEAWEIAKTIIESMAFGTNPLYNKIKDAILEILKQGPTRRKDIVAAIKVKYNVRTGWIDDILRLLVKLDVIEKCERGVYAILCPKSSQITEYSNNEKQNEQGGEE
jgi:hypothetical protein